MRPCGATSCEGNTGCAVGLSSFSDMLSRILTDRTIATVFQDRRGLSMMASD